MKLIDLMFDDYSYELGSKKIKNSIESFNSIEHLNKFESKVGIKHHFHSPDKSPYTLSLKALENLNFNFDNLSAILYMSQTDNISIPSVSSLLHNKLTDKKNVFCLDISQGCSGFIYSFYLSQLLCKSLSGSVLVVHSECYQNNISKDDKGTSLLFSDASFCYVTSDKSDVLSLDYSFWNSSDTKGSMVSSNDQNYYREISNGLIKMNGGDIYNFAIKNVPSEIIKILNEHSLKPSDISHFIPHQANKHLMNLISQKVNISNSYMICTLDEFANTVSCSIPLAMTKCVEEFKKGDVALLSGFGVGLSIANMIIKIK